MNMNLVTYSIDRLHNKYVDLWVFNVTLRPPENCYYDQLLPIKLKLAVKKYFLP